MRRSGTLVLSIVVAGHLRAAGACGREPDLAPVSPRAPG
jgi:hypothetical protein